MNYLGPNRLVEFNRLLVKPVLVLRGIPIADPALLPPMPVPTLLPIFGVVVVVVTNPVPVVPSRVVPRLVPVAGVVVIVPAPGIVPLPGVVPMVVVEMPDGERPLSEAPVSGKLLAPAGTVPMPPVAFGVPGAPGVLISVVIAVGAG
jgi:hypothetical protein